MVLFSGTKSPISLYREIILLLRMRDSQRGRLEREPSTFLSDVLHDTMSRLFIFIFYFCLSGLARPTQIAETL